jgi:hypothetical protein
MTSHNWRKGLMRLWLVCAAVWLLVAPFWTNVTDEWTYAFRYASARDTLRSDLLAQGACSPNPYDAVVKEYFGVDKKLGLPPENVANAAVEACHANNRVTRLDGNGVALPKEDCAAAYLETFFREKRAVEAEKKRQYAEAKRQSVEAEKHCNEVFTPEPPKFQTTLAVLGIPTLGVAAAVLMLMAFASVLRWVARGFSRP